MADLQAFADPAFDAKHHINAACAAARGDEPLERWGGLWAGGGGRAIAT